MKRHFNDITTIFIERIYEKLFMIVFMHHTIFMTAHT